MINLCSSDSSSDESYIITQDFSPIKAQPEPSPNSLIDHLIPNVGKNDYHDPGVHMLPILARPFQGLSVPQLFQLMIGSVPMDRICYRKPTGVVYNSVFVVDLSSIIRIEDLRADDNGAWIHGGKPRKKYIVEFDATNTEVLSALPFKQGDANEESSIFTLVRLYHRHKVTPEFQRRISYVLDHNGKMVKYAVVQYLFENGEVVPVVRPCYSKAKKHKVHKEVIGRLASSLCDDVGTRSDVLNSMWKRAERLLNDPNGICDAPGMINSKCVASETGGRPHIVTLNKQGLPICDDSCLEWKSQKVCSHVLAAAEVMGSLGRFLQSYKGSNSKSTSSRPKSGGGMVDEGHSHTLSGDNLVGGGRAHDTSASSSLTRSGTPIVKSSHTRIARVIGHAYGTSGASHTHTPSGSTVGCRSHACNIMSGTVGSSSHTPNVNSVGGGGAHGISSSSSRTHTPHSSTIGHPHAHGGILRGAAGDSACTHTPGERTVGRGGAHAQGARCTDYDASHTHSPSGSMVGATHAHAQDTSSGSTVATSVRTTGVHGSPIISSGRYVQLNCNSIVSSSVGTTPVIPPGSSAGHSCYWTVSGKAPHCIDKSLCRLPWWV